MRKILFQLVFTMALISIGCAPRVPLTQALIQDYHLSNSDMKKLQLYSSGAILLEQVITEIEKDVDSTHALKTVEDHLVKQIHFKRKTPCIAVTAQPDRLTVAFEQEGTLGFFLNPSHRKGKVFEYRPEKKNREASYPDRPPGAGFHKWPMIGTEQYNGSSYSVFVKSDQPYLLVDEESLRKLVLERRVAPGMRPGDNPESMEKVKE